MKLILRDISESTIEIEEPEIRIVDKKHPERSYIISLKGGYMLVDADYVRHKFHLSMESDTDMIQIEMSKEFIERVSTHGT